MDKEMEKMREIFEQFFFGPLNTVFGSFVNEDAKKHLNKARSEVLKAMRAFIDSEIEKLERGVKQGD
ncbi:MAG TPA: hypothetical protein VLH40_05880 [Atribacteraceae bacterium]|nr:hypothetical protein [Atribacteraceae bacterium]